MNRRRVLLDVDGVLAGFLGATLNILRDHHDVNHDDSTFPTWNIFETVDCQHQDAVFATWASPGWCESLPVYEGAVDGVARLREVADVYFVTSPLTQSSYWMWERVQWLKKHFAADDAHVVMTMSKHVVVGNVFIDDKPANILKWAEAHPDQRAILWDQPYNRTAALPPNGVRMSSWDGVYNILKD